MLLLWIVDNGRGYPERGVSAIEHLIRCIYDLLHVEWPIHPRFGRTTFNVGTINGGAAANIIPGIPLPLPPATPILCQCPLFSLVSMHSVLPSLSLFLALLSIFSALDRDLF
jgi:Peptidase dimerisation domain